MYRPVIALLPPFKHYRELFESEYFFAVRQFSQISNSIPGKFRFVLFDQYIERDLAQDLNKQGIHESLNHATHSGQNDSLYNGVSLVDIDHAEIFTKVFLHCYREALAFLSLVDRERPQNIVIDKDDPNRDIFQELSQQLDLGMETVSSIGTTDETLTDLIRSSNVALNIQDFEWHRPRNQTFGRRAAMLILNAWSKAIRKLRGPRPLMYIDIYGPISRLKAFLNHQHAYFPVYIGLTKIPLLHLLLGGPSVMPSARKNNCDREVTATIKKYKENLNAVAREKTIGQIKYNNKTFSITTSLVGRLRRIIPNAFKQVAHKVDLYEQNITHSNVAGALLSSDLNWEHRMIVRVCQKYGIENMVHMNGWFGSKHGIENKSASKILCFGENYISNYFNGFDSISIVGSPVFDAAFKKRPLVKPNYPIKKILIATATFSPVDINCRYSDHERFLSDILDVLPHLEQQTKHAFQITIRPHGSDSVDFYRWFLAKCGHPHVPLKPLGDFLEVAAECDLLIASYSTTVFEAAAMGIPVLYYNPSNQILFEPFDGSRKYLPAAFSKEDLARVLDRMMNDREYAYRFTDPEILKPYTGRMDGNSTKRIIHETIRMVSEK